MDLRIEKTYLSLHNTFTTLLEEKHFEDITVNELCERAMIRRATFYKHFADKYEYFSFYINEVSETFQKRFPTQNEPYDLKQYFIHMAQELILFIQNKENLVRHVTESNMLHILTTLLSEQMKNDLLSYVHKNQTNKKVDSAYLETLIIFYSGGLVNVILNSIKKGNLMNDSSIYDILKDISFEKIDSSL